MSERLIVKACLNGMRGRDANPAVPFTPSEVAEEAVRCAEAGASLVHFHARTAEGAIHYDPAWYAETDGLIRERTDLVLNHTTVRLPEAPIDAVLRTLRETPEPVDMISLNPGTLSLFSERRAGSRTTTTIPNSYEDVRRILEVCRERGIHPEPTVLDAGFLSNVKLLVDDGLLDPPRMLLLEFGGRYGGPLQVMPGTPEAYTFVTGAVRALFPRATWIAHGIEESVFAIASLAIANGRHVRLGFEDRTTLASGREARSNAELVAWAVAEGRAHGREPATPAEARAMLLPSA